MAKSAKHKRHLLFLDPEGHKPDFNFGVLRATFRGTSNDTMSFVTAKTALCSRSELLLPDDVADVYRDPTLLWSSFEAARVPGQLDLATVLTLYLPETPTLHAAWEEARSWALTEFARGRRLPTSLVLHAPALSGSPNDVHVHAVIAARQLQPIGWTSFSDLLRDAAQTKLWESWSAHKATWALGMNEKDTCR